MNSVVSTVQTLDPTELTQRLIRYDTTNPPGAERDCVAYVRGLADELGMDTRTVAADPGRPNLVARMPGRGEAPPVLLHAHVDVVPTDGQQWSHPPFDGVLADGHLWGRGAVDMKGGLAMMLSALSRLAAAGTRPAGDVVLAVVPDEEAGSTTGAGFLVDRHPELFDGVRHAIGEDGGTSLELGGETRFHPVVVGEKRACWLRVTLRGPGGHGSRVAPPDAPMRRLTRLLGAIAGGGLGIEPTEVSRRMLAELAEVAPEPMGGHLRRLRDDVHDTAALDALPQRDALYLRSALQHTVNATVIRAGSATNVSPNEAVVELDGRLLPGAFGTGDFLRMLREVVGEDLDAEVLVEGEPLPPPDFGPFYERLVEVLRTCDPDGVPVPMMTTASTDARLFAKLGISCYGWLPMTFPPGVDYRGLLHSPDERITTEALDFGSACFTELLRGER